MIGKVILINPARYREDHLHDMVAGNRMEYRAKCDYHYWGLRFENKIYVKVIILSIATTYL